MAQGIEGGRRVNNICHLSRYKPGAERLVNQPTKAWKGALDEMGRFGGGSTVRSVREEDEGTQNFKEIGVA